MVGVKECQRFYCCPGCGELVKYEQTSCPKCSAGIEWVKVPQLVQMSDEAKLRIQSYNDWKKRQ